MLSLVKMLNKFCYGEYQYDYYLLFEDRKSFSLIIYPNQKIVLKAPERSSKHEIDLFLTRKWVWLDKNLKEFEKYKKSDYTRKYLSGESFYYLGRQYILSVDKNTIDSVKVVGNRVVIYTTKSIENSLNNYQILNRWLDNRRNSIYKQQLIKVWKCFDYDKIPQIKVREMNKRWGSCSRDGKIITLNSKLIEAPTEAIRYVCTHELSHIKYRNHDSNFYRLMESHLPTNWRSIKSDLEVRFG